MGAPYQTRFFKNPDVFTDRRKRHGKWRSDVGDTGGSTREAANNGAARRIGDRSEYVIDPARH